MSPEEWKKSVTDAIWTLVNSASDEGCDGDLTVVNKSAVENLLTYVTEKP